MEKPSNKSLVSKTCIKGNNVNYADIDVINDNGTSKTNDIFSSTCDKEKAALLNSNIEVVTKILSSSRSEESEHN